MRVQRFRSMLSVFFTEEEVTDYTSVCRADFRSYSIFFHNMLEQGIYLPPSPMEAWFLSASHTAEDISRIIEAADWSLKGLKGNP
jgi:glutamate-1-semialdehyde 2,1-aminomutase